MAEDTITRAHLAEAVYQEVGLSRNESAELVEAVLHERSGALARGETGKISSFGSFFVRLKDQRVCRRAGAASACAALLADQFPPGASAESRRRPTLLPARGRRAAAPDPQPALS